MCNCNSTSHTTICQPQIPCEQNDCSCPVKDLSTDCVLYTGDTLGCSGVEKGTILTELIQQIDTYICTSIEQLRNSLNLVNVGTGLNIYKGINALGKREIRSLKTTNTLLTSAVSTNTNEIELGVDEEELSQFVKDNQIITEQGVQGSGILNFLARWTPNGTTLGTGLIQDDSSSVSIGEAPNAFSMLNILSNKANGITTSQSVSGKGIDVRSIIAGALPNWGFVSWAGNSTTQNLGGEIVVTGGTTSTNIGITTQVTGGANNYSVQLQDGTEGINKVLTSVTADGKANWVTPDYTQPNLQRIISSFPDGEYVLQPGDNNYTLILSNNTAPITIVVPTSLPSKFAVAFIQKGTGEVLFAPISVSVTVKTPIIGAYKVKGVNYFAYLEQEEGSNVFYLGGNIKV